MCVAELPYARSDAYAKTCEDWNRKTATSPIFAMSTIGVKHDRVVRYSKRKKVKVDYTMYDTLTVKKDEAFIKSLLEQNFQEANVQMYDGKDITKAFLREHGFRVPFLVPKKKGLGIEIPDDLTVEKVVELIGPETIIPVLDVHTQEGTSMKLREWGAYWRSTKEERIKKGRLNVISLEFSYTELGKLIKSPTVVRELDWIELCWKNHGGSCLQNYPRVQYYCLMGVEGSYTDFHIDFGGTSVWYHIVSGEKWFYMIPPTKRNLKIYQDWSKSQTQNATFLPSIIGIDQCRILKFTTGMTAMLPTGWIHAVYTPRDTLVIGGNFLHGLNMGLQLQVYEIEKISGVRDKFSFPHYERMQFYALEYYSAILDGEMGINGKEGTMPSHKLNGPEAILEEKKKITIKNALEKIWGAHLLNIFSPPGWDEEEDEDIVWNGVSGSSGYTISIPEDFENWFARRKYLWKNQISIRQKLKVEEAKKQNDRRTMNKLFLGFIQREDDGHAKLVNWLQHRKREWWRYHRKKRNTKGVKLGCVAGEGSNSKRSQTKVFDASGEGITTASITSNEIQKLKRSLLLGDNDKVNQRCSMLDETGILSKFELESLITFCNTISETWKIPGTKKQKEEIMENLEQVPILCLEKIWMFDECKMASVEYETEYGTEDAVETLTPYMEFKLSWLEDNKLKIKGKSKREVTAMLTKEWNAFSSIKEEVK